MKKTIATVLTAAMLTFLLVGCGGGSSTASPSPSADAAASPAASAEITPIKIVFAIPNGATNIETKYAEKWMDLVKERSNGAITFDYTNSGALGSYAELLEGVQNQVYDMTMTDPSYVQTYVPESVLMSLPMEFDSYDKADQVYDGDVGKWYTDLVASKTNLKIMNYFYCGFRYICSEKPITSLADCKDVLIRSPQIDVYTDLLSLMGFKYVTMSWSEAYTSMQTGVINAVEVPLQNIYEAGFFDLAKNICTSRHLLSVNCIVAGQEFWNKLPAADQDILTQALQEVTEDERTQCATNEQDYVTKLKDKGCTFTDFDAASKEQLATDFQKYWHTKVDSLGSDAQAQLEKIIKISSGS
ncbi:MAG: TRAP transporter substrate-binding protein [Oscillospiraceae bacterium]